MQTYTIDELLSICYTADKLCDIATTLAPRDSKEYRNARALTDIAYRLRHAAIIMENDPEAAALALIGIICPLDAYQLKQTA